MKNWDWFSVRSCRKGACSAATLARMPEHFTDTLGNWKSRAKETYRRTTLSKAQTEFCKYFGGSPKDRVNVEKEMTLSNASSRHPTEEFRRRKQIGVTQANANRIKSLLN